MKNSDRPTRPRLRRYRALPCLWLAAACAQAASPSPDADPDPWADAPTVRQLLHMDAAAALANRRALLAPSRESAPSGAGMPSVDRVRVAAIYGVGGRLQAEVLINDTLRIYRSGRKSAEGRQAATDGYDLVAITGACVSLRKRDEPVVACLESSPSSALE